MRGRASCPAISSCCSSEPLHPKIYPVLGVDVGEGAQPFCLTLVQTEGPWMLWATPGVG